MGAIFGVLSFLVWLYILVLFGRLVFDWIQVFSRDWRPRGALLVVAETVYSLTDPPLRAIRRVVRPVRLGQVQLDLAFIILFVLAGILQSVLASAAVSLG
ncbi:YggT family protein [Quadrisphaera sp. GCM10027208]|uniref:YggT family protein n=1 Tax=Quadrisphaera sp. GCM10027208 TaxID=3273423 RepID=UPI00361EE0A9|nr:YggT family protein [Kineosporiaceae bacterium SCSIO 59966]